jgi:hypothetical protein
MNWKASEGSIESGPLKIRTEWDPHRQGVFRRSSGHHFQDISVTNDYSHQARLKCDLMTIHPRLMTIHWSSDGPGQIRVKGAVGMELPGFCSENALATHITSYYDSSSSFRNLGIIYNPLFSLKHCNTQLELYPRFCAITQKPES